MIIVVKSKSEFHGIRTNHIFFSVETVSYFCNEIQNKLAKNAIKRMSDTKNKKPYIGKIKCIGISWITDTPF